MRMFAWLAVAAGSVLAVKDTSSSVGSRPRPLLVQSSPKSVAPPLADPAVAPTHLKEDSSSLAYCLRREQHAGCPEAIQKSCFASTFLQVRADPNP